MMRGIEQAMRATPAKLSLSAAAAAIVLLTWALAGRSWTGPFYDAFGPLAVIFVALPSTLLAEVLGPAQTLFRCSFIACEPATAGAWILVAAGDAAICYLLSCAAATLLALARRRLRPRQRSKPRQTK